MLSRLEICPAVSQHHAIDDDHSHMDDGNMLLSVQEQHSPVIQRAEEYDDKFDAAIVERAMKEGNPNPPQPAKLLRVKASQPAPAIRFKGLTFQVHVPSSWGKLQACILSTAEQCNHNYLITASLMSDLHYKFKPLVALACIFHLSSF